MEPAAVLMNLRAHSESDVALLPGTTAKLTVGRDQLFDFYQERYFDQYIAEGGSKVKLLIGPKGSGASHALCELLRMAGESDLAVGYLDARQVDFSDFYGVYCAIMDAVGIEDLLEAYYKKILADLGFEPPTEGTIIEHWARTDQERRQSGELQKHLATLLTSHRLHPAFATAVIQWVRSLVGYSVLSDEQRSILSDWLHARRRVISDLRRVNIFHRVERHNAREMLRSFTRWVREYLGKRGVALGIDNMDWLVTGTRENGRRVYGAVRRRAAYENFRELIDNVDEAPGLLLLLSGEEELLTDEKRGLKSYNALWLRVQEEIKAGKLNRFADLVRMDGAWSAESLLQLAQQVAALCKEVAGSQFQADDAWLKQLVGEALAREEPPSAAGHVVAGVLAKAQSQS